MESNFRFGNTNLALFETTKTFQSIKGFPVEGYGVAGVLTGTLEQEKFFGAKERPVDFYLLKGIVSALLADVEGVTLVPSKNVPGYMHPKICMDIVLGGKTIGLFGKLHPLTLKAFGIKTQEVWAFEFATKLIEKAYSAQDFEPAKDLPVFPPSLRDLSVVVDKSVTYAQIASALDKTPLDVNFSYKLIDLYQGEHLPEGKKSVTFSLAFSHPEHTLKDKEIDEAFNRIVEQLRTQTGAELR